LSKTIEACQKVDDRTMMGTQRYAKPHHTTLVWTILVQHYHHGSGTGTTEPLT